MKHSPTPYDYAVAANRLWWLAAEANTVMAMRVLGMAGTWNVTRGETRRMWREKPTALQKSAEAAMAATLSGKQPHQIMEAAIKPLDRAVTANRRRLSKRGPRSRFFSPSVHES